MSELLKGLRTNCSNPDWITVELRRTVTGCLYEVFCSFSTHWPSGVSRTHHQLPRACNTIPGNFMAPDGS